MCGIFHLDRYVIEDMVDYAGRVSPKVYDLKPGDIRPSNAALVMTGRTPGVSAEVMNWGFPNSGKLIINARGETVSEKKIFSESVLKRRCIIPADSFYEWDHEKCKVTFTHENEDILFLAGFYDLKDNEDRFVILTTKANASMEKVHDRMPLILSRDMITDWLYDDKATGQILSQTGPMLSGAWDYEQMSLFS